MDILNFISWIKGGRQVTSVDPAQTLLPVGLKDDRRDDGYLAGAISVADLAAQIAPQTSYKVFTALLRKGLPGNPPDLVVLENTIGPLQISYSGVGDYNFGGAGQVFTADKTYGIVTAWQYPNTPLIGTFFWEDNENIKVFIRDINGIGTDDIGRTDSPVTLLSSIEIRVYN